jgi:anti-anti-sigma factor
VDDEFALHLAVQIVDHPNPFVVKLVGEIEMTNAHQVTSLAEHPWNGHGTVIVDLDQLEFLGSAGICALMRFAEEAAEFRCRNVSSVVDRVLRLVGFDAWLDLVP